MILMSFNIEVIRMLIRMCDKVVSYVAIFWFFSAVNNLYCLFLLVGPYVLHIL
jgi:hypothetical protein